MTREEKIEIVANYYGSKLFASTIVDKLQITDEKIRAMKGKHYEPLTDD